MELSDICFAKDFNPIIFVESGLEHAKANPKRKGITIYEKHFIEGISDTDFWRFHTCINFAIDYFKLRGKAIALISRDKDKPCVRLDINLDGLDFSPYKDCYK